MFSRSYYSASAAEFLRASPAAVLGELVAHHTFTVDQNQRNAWQAEISHLQGVASALDDSFFSGVRDPPYGQSGRRHHHHRRGSFRDRVQGRLRWLPEACAGSGSR